MNGGTRTDSATRWLAACGIGTPVVDVLVIAWLGALDPGYSHVRQYISELGVAGRPYAGLFTAWSVLYGLLLVPFGIALRRGMGGGRGSWLGPVAFWAMAGLSVLGGIFPCDPGCQGRTVGARVHLLTGVVAAVVVLLSPFLTWAGMRGRESWRGFRAWTLAAGVVIVAAGGWLAVCHWASPGRHACPVGLAQRLLVGVWSVWLVALATRLWRRATATGH